MTFFIKGQVIIYSWTSRTVKIVSKFVYIIVMLEGD